MDKDNVNSFIAKTRKNLTSLEEMLADYDVCKSEITKKMLVTAISNCLKSLGYQASVPET